MAEYTLTEALSIRQGECEELRRRSEPCDKCSQYDLSKQECKVASYLITVIHKIEKEEAEK